MKDDDTDWFTDAANALDAWKPEVMVSSSLIAGWCQQYIYQRNNKLPNVAVNYQPQCIPSNDYSPIPLARVELEAGQPLMAKWVMSLQFQAKMYEDGRTAAKEAGCSQDDLDNIPGGEKAFHDMFRQDMLVTPALMAYSEAFWAAPSDWTTSGIIITGRWAINKEEQESVSKQGGGSFFNVGSDLQRCEDFIKKGPAPACIGWGSMSVKSDEHMAVLAVRSLQIAGQRGVIVAGWAGLSSESLKGADNEEELIKYCDENIFFMKAAPHEWLFPQCSCAVHHGGIGTTQASLGAGTPTIVTPVFADQMDIAQRMTDKKWGVGTNRLPTLTPEDLGAAIKKVVSDPTYKARTTELAAKMAKEDGCKRAVEILEGIYAEVQSGKYWEKAVAFESGLKEIRVKQRKLTLEQKMAGYNVELSKRFPELKAWNDIQMAVFSEMVGLLGKGLLWYVKGSKCLARAGEKLKSDEVGRYQEFTFLEVLEQKGSRLHVRRKKGFGPEEGWVSSEVKGVEIVAKVENVPSISVIVAESYKKLFSDIM
uniref:Erythromycin biosynthesis protein CIII-like C-terminal domain-containing protein n=1 Tax=Zooxanthella nutricula TaxID=1333877 RepID=A0A7S2HQK3_9DINO